MIYYHVEMEGLHEIEAALGMMKDKSKMVLRTAINNTAKQTVVLLVDEAAKQYYITSKTRVRKTLEVKKATASNLTAVVTSTGQTTEIYDFKVKPKAYTPRNRPKAGHTGNVKQSNPAKALYLKPGETKDKYKAFTVKYKSGHKSVAQRVPGTRMRDNPGKEGIKNLRSTSIPAMLGNEEGVYGVVNPKMYDMLQQNIQAQIVRYLS